MAWPMLSESPHASSGMLHMLNGQTHKDKYRQTVRQLYTKLMLALLWGHPCADADERSITLVLHLRR